MNDTAKQEPIEATASGEVIVQQPKALPQRAVSDSVTVLQVIERAALDPNVDTDKMKDMFALYERIEAKKAEAEFNKAMTAAQALMGRVSADAENPQTRSRYASYAALDRELRPIYTKKGFALSFDVDPASPENVLIVLCYVSHRAGHSRTYRVPMPADGKGAKGGDVMTKTHAAGSAMSYGMRYLLKLIFNVAVGEDDTDGNPPYETITEQQAADLQCLIDEAGVDKVKFLKHLKISSLMALMASSYAEAVRLLQQKKRQAGKVPPYPAKDFEKNLPAWRKAIADGKRTAEQIISMVSSKGTLTDRQKAEIKAVSKKKDEFVEDYERGERAQEEKQK